MSGKGSKDSKPSGSKGSEPSGSKPDAANDDAYEYISAVKDTFHDNRKKYNEFLAIVGNFKARRMDKDDCMKRARKLFKGHPDLLLAFKNFLPDSLELDDWHHEEVKKRR